MRASRLRCERARPGSRSSCSKRATASGAGSGLSDGSAVDRGGAWLGPKHDAIFGLARKLGATTYKTWVNGAHLLVGEGRTRRYTGLIPRISPLAVVTLALAPAEDQLDGQAGAARRPLDGAPGGRVGRALHRIVARKFGDPDVDRSRSLRVGGARPDHG
jgi:monoamine oxidase